MNETIVAMLLVLGFNEVSKLPKIKDVMKKYYKLALKTHPDKPGGSKEKFQKIEEAFRIVGDYIMKNTVENDDPEECLAKDLFKDIFSQFNTTKENKKCTTVLINNYHNFAWDTALTNYCGEGIEKAEGEKHWRDEGFITNGKQTTVTIRKWANPKNDGKSKMNIQSKNLDCVKMWILGVLPSIFDKVLDIVKSVVVDQSQSQTERVTRTRVSNKNGTKCNECETFVQSFTDLSKHKKMFHAKINSSSTTNTLARKNIQKMKTNSKEAKEVLSSKTSEKEVNMITVVENNITNNSLNRTTSIVQDTESTALELIENILDDVIKKYKRIECSHCGKLYQRPHMLKKHIETNHQTETESSSMVHTEIVIDDQKLEEEREKALEKDEDETVESHVTDICRQCGDTLVNICDPDMHICPSNSHRDLQKQTEALIEEKNLRLKAQQDLRELDIKYNELIAEKDELRNEFLQKIDVLEKKLKDDVKTHNKAIKLQQSKIVLLENAAKNYVTELDKQVQLKEKFSEEKKTLTNIIKTHIELKDLKVDLKDILCIDEAEATIQETRIASEDEWEDIDSVDDDLGDNAFVKVMNKRKKKQRKRLFASKEFKDSKRNDHQKQHVPQHACIKCGNLFPSEHDLRNHMNDHTNHTVKQNFECEKCKNTFITEKNLAEHIETNHKNINPIKCRLCDFKTIKQVNFLLHMESHNTENNYLGFYSRKKICSWYLRGICRFGPKCRNNHSDPPQCIFKNKCRSWPSCKYGHYEVCKKFESCENQNCVLEHPSRPFLGPVSPQKTPNIHSIEKFPRLQKRQRSQ